MTPLNHHWTTATASGGNGCVQARHDVAVHVRDSKLGDASPILAFPTEAWREFVDAIRADQFTQS